MNRPLVLGLSVCLIAVPLTLRARQTSLRATAESVIVDALVTRDNVPIGGLKAADFVVRDNGALQRVELMPVESVPVDLRMALDLGVSDKSNRLQHLKDAAHAVVAALRAGDRAELLTFSNDVALGAGLTGDREQLKLAIDRMSAAGWTSLVDTAFTTLALPAASSRRTLVLLFTDGRDTSSWLSHADVIETAAQSRVTLYGVTVPPLDGPPRVLPMPSTRLFEQNILKHPVAVRRLFLVLLARETGGELLQAAGTADLGATFLDVLSRFNRRYLLSYTPTGVTTPGWHQIDVLVKDKSMRVTARRGYERRPVSPLSRAGASEMPETGRSPDPR